MQKVNKKIALFALCVLLCRWVAPWTQASNQEVTLTVEYIYEESAVVNAEVEVYLVATYTNGIYTMTEQFEDLTVTFESMETPSSWREEGEDVEAYIHAAYCDCQSCVHTDGSGSAYFDDLVVGVYYVGISDVNIDATTTLVSNPLLITLPIYDNETQDYIYDVVMEPKISVLNYTPGDPGTPDKPDTPDEPDEPAPSIPQTPSDPGNPDEPDTPKPDVPDEPDEPDDPVITQTGTSVWLVLPLALMGVALMALGLLGLSKKRGAPWEKH